MPCNYYWHVWVFTNSLPKGAEFHFINYALWLIYLLLSIHNFVYYTVIKVIMPENHTEFITFYLFYERKRRPKKTTKHTNFSPAVSLNNWEPCPGFPLQVTIIPASKYHWQLKYTNGYVQIEVDSFTELTWKSKRLSAFCGKEIWLYAMRFTDKM